MLEFLFLCVTTPNELQCMVVGVVPGLQIVHCHMLLQKLTDLLQPANKDLRIHEDSNVYTASSLQ